MDKIVNFDKIEDIICAEKAKGKCIVSTNGCFDILHVGHVRYLKKARKLGDLLVLGLNSDESVKRLKGPSRPINNENDRAEVIAALECVDYVVIFNEDTPEYLLSLVKPNIHAKGGDYTVETLPEAETIIKNNGKIEFISLVEGKSTTNIINKAKL